MKNRRRAVGPTVAFAVLLVTLSLAASPPAKAATEMPIWHIGDWWQYAATNVSSPAGRGEANLKILVVGTADVTAGGVTYAAYDTKDWLNVTARSVIYSITGHTWYRTTDLATVRAQFAFATTAPSGIMVTVSVELTLSPPQEIRWPLSAGLSWSSDSSLTQTTVTTFGSFTQTNTTSRSVSSQYTAQATSQVTVPKGAYTATAIQNTQIGALGYEVSYWSADVGNVVKDASYDSNGNETSSQVLSDYSYTTPVGTARFLGMAWWWWTLIAGYAAAIVIAGLLLLRPKRPKGAVVPPNYPSPTQPAPPSADQGPAQPGSPPPFG